MEYILVPLIIAIPFVIIIVWNEYIEDPEQEYIKEVFDKIINQKHEK